MSRDKTYLIDILKAAQSIRRFVKGVTNEEFLINEEKYEAVNRKFEIIGEAANRLSPEMRREFPDIPPLIERLEAYLANSRFESSQSDSKSESA